MEWELTQLSSQAHSFVPIYRHQKRKKPESLVNFETQISKSRYTSNKTSNTVKSLGSSKLPDKDKKVPSTVGYSTQVVPRSTLQKVLLS